MPVAPAAPSADSTSAPVPAYDPGLADRIARIEATQRASKNSEVFGELVGRTTLKPAYKGIVADLVKAAVGPAANYADPAIKARVASTIDALPGAYPDMFGPKVERAQSQSEWADQFAKARAEKQLPANSIAAKMNPVQLERVLKGGR